MRIFYHEAKMLACKGIFAKPSRTHPCTARSGEAAKAYASKALCVYYTTSGGRLQDRTGIIALRRCSVAIDVRLKIEKGSEKAMAFCQNSLAANKGHFICLPEVSHLLRLPFESSVIIYGTKTGDALDVLLGERKADRL